MAALELVFFWSYLRPLPAEAPLRLLLEELELLVELELPLWDELLLELLGLALELLLGRLLEPLTLLELLPLGRLLVLGRVLLLELLLPLGRLTVPLDEGRLLLELLTLLELFGREVLLLLGRLTVPLELPFVELLLGRLTLPLLLPAGRLSVFGRLLGVALPPLPELMLPTGPLGLTVALGATSLLGLGISLLLHSGWVAG